MMLAWTIIGIVFMWYGHKAVKANPDHPNWTKAITATLFWPFSIFMGRY